MARNRATKYAPGSLMRLSKATLADLVWELAGVAPSCASADEPREVMNAIGYHAGLCADSPDLGIPARDRRIIAKLRDGTRYRVGVS